MPDPSTNVGPPPTETGRGGGRSGGRGPRSHYKPSGNKQMIDSVRFSIHVNVLCSFSFFQKAGSNDRMDVSV
jgi:hypothetical protein